MRVLILGADGYLGWPTAMYLADQKHDVFCIDSLFKRAIVLEQGYESLTPTLPLQTRTKAFEKQRQKSISFRIGDVANHAFLCDVFEQFSPDAVIHYAEQPSGPWSMMNFDHASRTLHNNVGTTLSLIWAILKHNPKCHLIKYGTMGEYGTPKIPIEEGFIDIEHKGKKDRFLFPRQAGSLYHTTKILDTDLLWFYVRMHGITVTDIMQGPVYGLPQVSSDLQTSFYYDDIFGTVINRFLAQALIGHPLTVYGKGGQTRGYLNILDTLECIRLCLENPAQDGELRIMNQFTQTLSVLEIAQAIQRAAQRLDLDVNIQSIDNPRIEAEQHAYDVEHQKLLDLGLKPTPMTDDILEDLLRMLMPHADRIQTDCILPTVHWRQDFSTAKPTSYETKT